MTVRVVKLSDVEPLIAERTLLDFADDFEKLATDLQMNPKAAEMFVRIIRQRAKEVRGT